MEYGVTGEGFIRKNYNKILEDLEQRARDLFGEDVDLTETSPLKLLLQSTALEIAKLWDILEYNYYSNYLESASGSALDRVVALVGVSRNPATESSGTVVLGAVTQPTTTISEGRILSTPNNIRFATTEPVPPTVWTGEEGDFEASVQVEAIQPGSDGNVAPHSITEFVDSIPGVVSAYNPYQFEGGTDRETDAQLRDRAAAALDVAGNATEEAIINAVMGVPGVDSVTVEELPDRSIVVTYGGPYEIDPVTSDPIPDPEVVEVVEKTRAFGIPAQINPSEQVPIWVYAEVQLTSPYPEDADEQLQQSIIDYITNLPTGADVIWSKLKHIIFMTGDWVYDAQILKITRDEPSDYTDPDDANYTEQNITIDSGEKATVSYDEQEEQYEVEVEINV